MHFYGRPAYVEQPPKGQPTCAAEGSHNAGEQRRRPRRSAQLQCHLGGASDGSQPSAVRTMSHRKTLQKRPVRTFERETGPRRTPRPVPTGPGVGERGRSSPPRISTLPSKRPNASRVRVQPNAESR